MLLIVEHGFLVYPRDIPPPDSPASCCVSEVCVTKPGSLVKSLTAVGKLPKVLTNVSFTNAFVVKSQTIILPSRGVSV